MRSLVFCWAALLALPASGDKLSDIDVQLLIERLEELQGGAKGRTGARFSAARAA
ncbi:MAG: hypothetical protein HKN82_12820, partial [Akkermansiaceae bacterium]|nr:hypothetical protein [Akkermansiaceae bacterium]